MLNGSTYRSSETLQFGCPSVRERYGMHASVRLLLSRLTVLVTYNGEHCSGNLLEMYGAAVAQLQGATHPWDFRVGYLPLKAVG
jgi:hypothetical protein